MKIFLTGESGFIGKRFITGSFKSRHTIYEITRKKKKSKKNLVWLRGDLDKDWSTYLIFKNKKVN